MNNKRKAILNLVLLGVFTYTGIGLFLYILISAIK